MSSLLLVIHASVELVEAMAGIAPCSTQKKLHARQGRELAYACGLSYRSDRDALPGLACEGYSASKRRRERPRPSTRRPVTCPLCLAKIAQAIGPVRGDQLEERRLAAEQERVYVELRAEREAA